MLFDQQIELFEFRLHGVDVTKVEFITLIKRAVSPCASLLPYLNTRLRYASYPFWSGTSRTIFVVLRRQQCQDIAERSRLLVPSFVCRDSLHSWVCCHRSQLGQQRAVHRSHEHVSANSQSLYSSSAPLKAVGLFSLATSFATVTVLTAPTVD